MKELARELRIGNYVMYNGYSAVVYGIQGPEPHKIDRLDGKYLVTLNLGGLITVPIDEVDPLVITEEIFEKWGFISKADGSWEIPIADYGYVFKYFDWRDDYSVGITYYNPIEVADTGDVFNFNSPGLTYVHQLQNLYYFLQHEELELKL